MPFVAPARDLASAKTRDLTLQDIIAYFKMSAPEPNLSFSAYPLIQKAAINTGQGLGVWNPIYGAQAWYQLNTESNWFASMPKFTWDKSGFRIIMSFTREASQMAITQTGTLPTPTIPNIEVVKITPKQEVNTFMTTQIVQKLASESIDDIFGNLDTIRALYATEHVKLLNEQIGTLVVGTSPATSLNGSNNLAFESIDRIVSSYAEGIAAGLSSTSTPTISQVLNPWLGAINRGAGASRYDAYVVSGSTFLTGSSPALAPAAITDATLRKTIQGVRTNGANTNIMVTGYNTYASVQGLYQTYVRYFPMSETLVSFDYNGIQTGEGVIGGVQVATIYGIPLLTAVNTPSSQGNGFENIYLLDSTDTENYGYGRLGVQMLQPTTYNETDEQMQLLLQSLTYEGMYVTIGEMITRFFGAQAKIRDITG